VLDLVGNVWEWTGSKASAYKGNDPNVAKQIEERNSNDLVIRGAFNPNKESSSSTSTYRGFSAPIKRDKVIGFRLVRSE
jgi:formylglycine-generating enzyme required for sulfatase activity